jgi:23S rRNA pseudouridine1911/1915/1917 synthase
MILQKKEYVVSFIKQHFLVQEPIKAFEFLMQELKLYMKEAQKTIAKKRLFCNGKVIHRANELICGEVIVIVFSPSTKNLKPIFQTKDFAVFDKPSGVLSHPNSRHTSYSILHEAQFQFGKEANIVHRLDAQTSGLILVSKHKNAEKKLKVLFENKEVTKTYLALINGEIEKETLINKPIFVGNKSRLRVELKEEGKEAKTLVVPLRYNKKQNYTLIKAIPKTGRQHQIRAHLFHVKHSILGDHIYGQDDSFCYDFLAGKISDETFLKQTKASRLMLHAHSLEFTLNGVNYHIKSQKDFLESSIFI